MENKCVTKYIAVDAEAYASLQARCDKYEKERHETRLAIRMLLKAFKGDIKTERHKEWYAKAEAIFNKHHQVTDVLRNEALGEGKEVEKPMEYNVCETCGAGGGKAGILINNECRNCYETRKTRAVTIHTNIERTQEEIDKTIGILNQKEVK